jgi:SAM domain (Sterile alpha motif)/IBR domain, a half RING-finger domain
MTLHDIPAAEIAAKLRENAVDGSVLLQLCEEDLRSGLGIAALGHRKKLMNYIQ